MVEETRARPRTSIGRLLFALLFAAHVALAAAPFSATLLEGQAPDFGDHWIHFTRAQASAAIFENTGALSGYDPGLVAGYPHGVVDSNSPASRLLVTGLAPLLGLPRAYALWVILAFALIPIGLWLSVRVLGGGSGCANRAAGAAILLLQLDPIARGMARNGMAAWLLSGAVLMTFAGLFATLLARPTRRRLAWTVACLPLISVHALLPALVALVFLVILGAALIERRADRGRVLLAAAGVGAAGLLLNLWWAWPLMRHFGLAGFPGQAFKPKIAQVIWDLASVVVPKTGYFNGSLGLRWGIVIVGLIGAASLLREARPRAVIALVLTPLFLALAYFGGFSDRLVKLECHRLVTIAAYAAALTLGPGISALRSWAGSSRGRLIALAIAALPFFISAGSEALVASRAPLRPHSLTRDERRIVDFFAEQPITGRVLTEQGLDTALTYALANQRRHPMLSFRAAGQPYLFTGWDPLVGSFLGEARNLSVEEVQARLVRYAVAWVVPSTREGRTLMRFLPRACIVRVAASGRFEVWRVRRQAELIARGAGRVDARPGVIELRELEGPVELRLHFHPGLRAVEGPGVIIERLPSPGDAAGFIRVDPRGRERVRIVWRP